MKVIISRRSSSGTRYRRGEARAVGTFVGPLSRVKGLVGSAIFLVDFGLFCLLTSQPVSFELSEVQEAGIENDR